MTELQEPDPSTRLIKGLGWRPSLPDIRDYRPTLLEPVALPAELDPREDPCTPPIDDQGQLGACTADGGGRIAHYALNKAGITLGPAGTPSRLLTYYRERAIEHSTSYDSGAAVRDALRVMSKGLVDESEWPYDVDKFAVRPPHAVYVKAREHCVTRYAAVPQDALSFQRAIMAGCPVVFGFTVYESFEKVSSDGIMPMPNPDERVLGGHCVVLAGWTRISGSPFWIVPNSWGTNWGDGGWFYMPMGYPLDTNLASDFWIIEAVR